MFLYLRRRREFSRVGESRYSYTTGLGSRISQNNKVSHIFTERYPISVNKYLSNCSFFSRFSSRTGDITEYLRYTENK